MSGKLKHFFGLIAFFLVLAAHASAKPVALFYLTDEPESIRSFLAHSGKIDLLVPAWYQVDEVGLVSGGPNPMVLGIAQKQHLPVMPIVALFDKRKFHELIGNATARQQLIASLIRESRLNGYTGFQIDFEDISWTDRDGLTGIVKEIADALHKENLQLSIATVPNAPGYPGKGGFAKWIYEDWRGAYDLAALARSVDLICLMTYDQHTRWTEPGPVATWQWTVDNLDYALKVVPREKLSLGIPLYGYHWYTGPPLEDKATGDFKPNPMADYISTPNALQLAEAYKGRPQWDEDDHSAFLFFYRDNMREWIFYTDLRAFSDRYKLVEDRGLQGFCSWELGSEDPAIWNFLPARH